LLPHIDRLPFHDLIVDENIDRHRRTAVLVWLDRNPHGVFTATWNLQAKVGQRSAVGSRVVISPADKPFEPFTVCPVAGEFGLRFIDDHTRKLPQSASRFGTECTW